MKQISITLLLLCSRLRAGDALGMEVGSPLIDWIGSAGQAIGTTDLNGSTLRFAPAIFQCAEAMTINGLGFYYALRTGTPPTYRISLQALDASGNPDGTVLGGGSPASATFLPPADTTWNATTRLITLSNNYTCTRGEFLGMVIDYSSGTVDGSNFGRFGTVWAQFSNGRQGFPNPQTYNGSAWTKLSEQPMFFYTSTGSKTYGFPALSLFSSTVSSGAEQALFFTMPSGLSSTYTVRGVRMLVVTSAAAKSLKVVLYSGTTVLQSTTFDTDNYAAVGSTGRLLSIWFSDTTLATLTAGTQYRIGMSPQDASNALGLMGVTLHDAQALTAFPGGSTWGISTRTGCGAPCDSTSTSWTDLGTNTRPLMSLILGDATGGGGQRGYPIQ